jgi:hypothetical protein
MKKDTLRIFGKQLAWCGPGMRWDFPGGWIQQRSQNWCVWSHGCSAVGDSPELAVRRLLLKATKVVEAIG